MTIRSFSDLFGGGVQPSDPTSLTVVGVGSEIDVEPGSPLILSVNGQTFSANDAIYLSEETVIDSRIMKPGVYYFPLNTGPGGADVSNLVRLEVDNGGNAYNKLADLPDPTSVTAGETAIVVQDGLNNGTYVAIGNDVGGPAESWVPSS